MKKIIVIIGARPQFIKHFPFEKKAKANYELITIHTGQHYDKNMSEVFFNQLGMEKPNYMLKHGGGMHGEQTGRMMIEIEGIVIKENPDAIIVYGDTNSTLAGALISSKLKIPLVHIEAGLRSFNKEMPEEINRVLTDHVSDLLLVPSQSAAENLKKEGITEGVFVTGDIMKDLLKFVVKNKVLKTLTNQEKYFYATLHRPYNVDEENRLRYVLESLAKLKLKVIFAIHPRTRKKLEEFNIQISSKQFKNITLIDPQPYFENLSYLYNSEGLITDSGGMQKEAYWMKKPCITIRKETEWVETLKDRSNKLLFNNLEEMNFLSIDNYTFDENLYGNGNSSDKMINQISVILN